MVPIDFGPNQVINSKHHTILICIARKRKNWQSISVPSSKRSWSSVNLSVRLRRFKLSLSIGS